MILSRATPYDSTGLIGEPQSSIDISVTGKINHSLVVTHDIDLTATSRIGCAPRGCRSAPIGAEEAFKKTSPINTSLDRKGSGRNAVKANRISGSSSSLASSHVGPAYLLFNNFQFVRATVLVISTQSGPAMDPCRAPASRSDRHKIAGADEKSHRDNHFEWA